MVKQDSVAEALGGQQVTDTRLGAVSGGFQGVVHELAGRTSR